MCDFSIAISRQSYYTLGMDNEKDRDKEKLPRICDRKGKNVNLYPGVYSICSCGLSKDQPYCDGAHQGTDFVPKRFKLQEPQSVYMCMCKHSKAFPYCDGSHKQLD